MFVGGHRFGVLGLHPEHETVGTVCTGETISSVHECPQDPNATSGGVDPHREERSGQSFTLVIEGQHGETDVSAVLVSDEHLMVVESLPPVVLSECCCFSEGRRECVRSIL